MWTNPQETTDLVTFTEEILHGKIHVLCIGKSDARMFYRYLGFQISLAELWNNYFEFTLVKQLNFANLRENPLK